PLFYPSNPLLFYSQAGDNCFTFVIKESMDELLEEGIDKFVKPFDTLMDSLITKVKQLSPA
ncbi:MAG: hypothetical protein AAFQ89_04575, partial [Cyanobacteria bacterium J06626_18]